VIAEYPAGVRNDQDKGDEMDREARDASIARLREANLDPDQLHRQPARPR
jgi:hypothetical protein